MEDTRRQESFERNMVQIDIPTEKMNENVECYETQPRFRVDIETDPRSRKIVAQGLSSEYGTVAREPQASEETSQVQEKRENLSNENLESKAHVEGSSEETEATRLHENIISLNNEIPLFKTLRNIEEMMCQVLISIFKKKESGTQSSKEQGLAERVEAHCYNINWRLLRDAYLPRKGNLSIYWKELLENEIFKQESPLRNTVLHVAARNGNDKLVEKIAQQASNLLTAKNSNDDTPLHVAAKAGHFSTVESLVAAHLSQLPPPSSEKPLEPQQEILEKNKQGNTFFHEALKFNDKKRVRTSLVSHDGVKEVAKRVAVQINNEMKSALYLAIEAGNKDVVEHALAEVIPGDPNYVPEGKSPLLAAITKRKKDMLHIILSKKPEWIHLRDAEGRIPLHYAASIGYLKGVEILLGKCASCAMEKDEDGYYPLHLASYGGHVKVVKKLLELEHSPDLRDILDNCGRNILHLAVESGKFDVVWYILKAANPELGNMINDKDANENTPLHLATLRCHPKIVHALTWDKRVDLTLVNRNGQTALDAFYALDVPENPSLRQRLTWTALRSAGVRSARQLSSSIKVPPKSTVGFLQEKAPNMDLYKDRINTLILVSTLIVTVTFAAGFTLPGGTNGSNPGQGMALMLNRVWFKLFIFCITTSMYGAISVTIILIWAMLGDLTLAIHSLRVAGILLGITLATLSLAFLAGVHLVITDLSWLATSSMIMGFVFIFMLLLLYTLLWLPSASSNPIVRYISYYPFLYQASLIEPDDE